MSGGILAVSSPLLDPSKTCPVPVSTRLCVFDVFVEQVVDIFDGTTALKLKKGPSVLKAVAAKGY